MEKTERRFKVVLCGLHNVLRNTERANHPLAHFGEPLCVGPLLANGGLEQARALIREPMAAVGYEFETDNLITKILFWTNYYPSLIQLFGQTLLRYLRLSPERGFPRTITDDDIQAVFSRHQFRDYIRNRFSLTLQLDQRYEVIAYAMAFDLQGAFDRLAEGLSNNRIFELVREYWREGFDISKREFGTLLREMCGLGVLRQRTDGKLPGRYVFRNPNVLRLLGDADTILDVLYKVRELPVTFEASAFHAQFDRPKAGSPRRGPLTYEQETELNRGGRVAVLSGSRATNFADVDKFLSERAGQSRLRPLKPSMDANTLVREVKRLRPDRDNYICLVDVNEPWTLLWLERVADAIREVQRGRQLRVVFRANPGQLWRFVSELPDEYLHADNSLFDWFAAQPWNAAFLRHWCSDLGLHDAGARIAELLELTGGWPMLLERYAASEEQSWKARSAELEQYIADHKDDLLDAVGLGTPASRLEIAPLLAWERLTTDEVETYAGSLEGRGQAPGICTCSPEAALLGRSDRNSAGSRRGQRAKPADQTDTARKCSMKLWDLPGARRFVDATCDYLRGGSSVVIRFPGKCPEGFDNVILANLGNLLNVGRVKVTSSPLKNLAERFTENPSQIGRLQDLCDDPGFRGRLVWLDGLDSYTWPAWRDFIVNYADVNRSRPLIGRSLFLVSLVGLPPPDAPPTSVGFVRLEWDSVLDDVDLLLFATERLRVREDDPLLRSLLATTIARVAAWDFNTAASLCAENNDTIMEPCNLLRTIAHENGWTTDTPLDWHLGTASRAGIVHPARAALNDPPDDLNRRLWSAQLTVMLPWIEARRHETVAANLFEVKRQMRANGDGQGDPYALELGTLVSLFSKRGANRRVRKVVLPLRNVRNQLAHRRHVAPRTLIGLMELLSNTIVR